MLNSMTIKNVKKNGKEYMIYFLTLVLAIALFYSFNSIDAQTKFAEFSAAQLPYLDVLTMIITIVSSFITLVFAGLIVYANTFIIAKRSKEFAIYLLLGMRKLTVASLLAKEALLIGVVSLVVGLGIGILLSQVLAILSAQLFSVTLNYQFVFSQLALVKTVGYFCLIFIAVLGLNIINVSRLQLKSLLIQGRKNTVIQTKSGKQAVIICGSGIALVGLSYYVLVTNGLVINLLLIAGVLMLVIGTGLFFYGFGSAVGYIVGRRPKYLYHQLNMIVLKQIETKFNTQFLLMSGMALMLMVSMSLLSLGIGFKTVMEQSREAVMPFAATVRVETEQELVLPQNVQTATARYYQLVEINRPEFVGLAVMTLTDYNTLQALQGKPFLSLEANSVAMTSDQATQNQKLQQLIEQESVLTIADQMYTIQDEVIDATLSTNEFPINAGTIIVPDEVVESLVLAKTEINFQYEENSEFEQTIQKFITDTGLSGQTKKQLLEDSNGLTTVVLYVDIYLGIIFLITGAAVLAIQQLIEMREMKRQIQTLHQIGATKRMIQKAVLLKVSINFGLPLIVALAHTLVAIQIATGFFATYGDVQLLPAILATAMVVIGIYGGYFYATVVNYQRYIQIK